MCVGFFFNFESVIFFQNETLQDPVTREKQVTDTDTVAIEIVNSLGSLLRDQIKMTTVNMLQVNYLKLFSLLLHLSS